jgi:ATP-dependent helicase/nuclease subunit A
MTAPDEATTAQMKAARPDASTWLSANAGSGKTRVLTDRVARLLLNGVDPEKILCLTYTKAAASEMQNRLFKRLGEWAMLPERELQKSLSGLGAGDTQTSDNLKDARTLFARAIETPGGLKVQTIHSFCASLLRRFPLEARVSPQFKEIEDRAADLLRAEIVDAMAEGPQASVVYDLAQHYTGEDLAGLTRAIVRQRDAFSPPLTIEAALDLFGLPVGFEIAALPAQVITPDLSDWVPQTCDILRGQSATMVTLANTLGGIDVRSPTSDDLQRLKDAFLKRKDGALIPEAKTGSVPTKNGAKALGPLTQDLHDLMERTAEAHGQELAWNAAHRTLALHRFAAAFLPRYEAEKQLRGWLDFDDLIRKARQLLTDPQVAAWVLYRIDGGIDHILVDEAQDTSPAQWDVIRKLAAEFSSGQGARPDTPRTVFVVGDKKQSIYSFQGADPREFDRMQAEFRDRIEAAGLAFQSRELRYSFRSSPAILRLVDRVFTDQPDAGFTSDSDHIAFHSDLPGRVDLWPVVERQDAAEDRKWSDPLDRCGPQHHSITLAHNIAAQIKAMIDDKVLIPDVEKDTNRRITRPVRPGDFLILVQRRSELFAEIIRACKSLNLDIAGADRLKVGAELAVRDLAALLSFLAMPDDSLSLATALKSPLLGWSEQELFTLAHRRTEDHLWQALRTKRDQHPDTVDMLFDLRDMADFLRPYDLIERILTRHKGRKKLLARLGPEAEDGVNALLSQALAYEQTSVPSLTGFLVWMQTDDLEIKRQVDSGSDQIRVMTVHGAKGLESPIVILPDTGERKLEVKDDVIDIDGHPVWKTRSAEMPPVMSTAIDQRKADEANERLRLLYVALTRAEKWLIVAAAGDLPDSGDTWYQRVETALIEEGAAPLVMHGGAGLRLQHGSWDDLPLVDIPISETPLSDLPEFFSARARGPARPPETLSPSQLEGAKALPGEQGLDEDAAKTYGTEVHTVLEYLAPRAPADWAAIASALTGHKRVSEDAAHEAIAVLQTPQLAFLFGPESLSEVDISARLGVHPMQGTIDRLIIEPDRILAVDFKTNRTVPQTAADTPLGVLRQMGAYVHGLAQIFPDRRIETAIVWTRTCALMYLPHDIVMDALHSTPYLDDAATGS